MRKVAIVWLLVGVISLIAIAPASALTIGFSPSSSTAGIGDLIGIDVLVTKSADEIVAAYDLDVSYNSSVLTATNVTFGSSLGAPDYSLSNFVLSYGLIDFADVSFLSDSELLNSQAGSFTLATLFFHADAAGTSPLLFANYLDGFNDIKGANNVPYLTATLDTGLVTVEGTAPVPEPSTMLLFSAGLIGLWGFRRKFNR
jgi:hypothetical protein